MAIELEQRKKLWEAGTSYAIFETAVAVWGLVQNQPGQDFSEPWHHMRSPDGENQFVSLLHQQLLSQDLEAALVTDGRGGTEPSSAEGKPACISKECGCVGGVLAIREGSCLVWYFKKSHFGDITTTPLKETPPRLAVLGRW